MARPRKRDPTELSRFLDQALARKGLNHTQFSQQVGISPSSLSDLKLRHDMPAPGREVARKWARVLDLNREEEKALFELLQLACSPAYVRELVAELRPARRLSLKVAERPHDGR